MNAVSEQKPGGRPKFREVLAKRDFFRLWIGQIVASIGDRFYQFAILKVVLHLTQGGFGAGKESARVLFSGMILTVLFFPWIGGMVDRHSRKNVMLFADVSRAFLVLVMLGCWKGFQSPPLMFVLIAVTGLMSGIFIPARQASVAMLVERRQLVAANALVTIVGVVASLAGACAGFVVAIFGESSSFIITSCGFLFSALMIWRIRARLDLPGKSERQVSWRVLREAFTRVWSERTVRFLFLIGGISQFVTGLYLIFAIEYAVTELDLGIVERGMAGYSDWVQAFGVKRPVIPEGGIRLISLVALLLSTGLGLLGGVTVSGKWFRLSHWQALPLLMLMLLGGGIVGLSQVQSFGQALGMCLLIGFAGALLNIPVESRLQAHVQGEEHGRVFAAKTAWGYVCFLAALAVNLDGSLLKCWGASNMVLGLGLACLMGGVGLSVCYPSSWRRSWSNAVMPK